MLYEVYLRAKIKEAVMEKHGGKDGISREYGCVNGGREVVQAIDDEEHRKIASNRIEFMGKGTILSINNPPNEHAMQVLDELLERNSSEIEQGNQVSLAVRIFANDGFQVEEREKNH